MPKKTHRRVHRKRKTRKQKPINMVGCSKKHKRSRSCRHKSIFSLGIPDSNKAGCQKCGPNCHCGPNCSCPHPCPGTCYLNRRKSQKGGSGCGSCGCPIAPMSTAQMKQYGGGNMPGPFNGSPWGAPVQQWPTYDGISGDRNYLSNYANVIQNDPSTQLSMSDAGYTTRNSMVGGYRYTPEDDSLGKTSKKMKGGFPQLVPDDLVNLGRGFTYNMQSAYNALNGYSAPVDYLPYKGQLK